SRPRPIQPRRNCPYRRATRVHIGYRPRPSHCCLVFVSPFDIHHSSFHNCRPPPVSSPPLAYNDEPMSVIEIRGLQKSYRVYQKKEGLRAALGGLLRREYKEVKAVRGIDLNVEQGEFVAFLGPNGAGKTTTLKLLSGVINPTAGSAHVLGFVPWERE